MIHNNQKRFSDINIMRCSSLSDFSDYDSSDAEWQAAHGSGTVANKKASTAGPSSHVTREYASLEDDFSGKSGLLAKEDDNPFGDPFADELDTPVQEKQRLQCEWCKICLSEDTKC